MIQKNIYKYKYKFPKYTRKFINSKFMINSTHELVSFKLGR